MANIWSHRANSGRQKYHVWGSASDKHMDFAQALLKHQHSNLTGLLSTLLIPSHTAQITIQPALQIVHSRGNHWIVVTTLQCPDKTVKVHVFDSLYTSTDPSTSQLLCKLYGADVKIQAEKCPKQLGVKDCGLFAIAIATVLAKGGNPSQVRLKQDAMRGHLINCFEKFELAPFPTN